MKEVKMYDGSITLVDDEDYEWAMKSTWYNYGGYAVTCFYRQRASMHTQLLDVPKGFDVHHIDGNPLNNQKANLTQVTRGQNKQASKSKNNTSGFIGVSWHKHRKLWCASIRVNYKQYSLGGYETPEEAAKAYDVAAIKYFGLSAKTNFQCLS